MKVTLIIDDLVHVIDVPAEWLEGRRGFELLGSKAYDAHRAAVEQMAPVPDPVADPVDEDDDAPIEAEDDEG